ncbi:hypothetical protein PGR6_45730 [Pseudomonas sp. GR 6-02]|nr:hypothetical protein PGR6_45730 [Pseudomonas sp. GR 6-02]
MAPIGARPSFDTPYFYVNSHVIGVERALLVHLRGCTWSCLKNRII